jgi:hypothetical protein
VEWRCTDLVKRGWDVGGDDLSHGEGNAHHHQQLPVQSRQSWGQGIPETTAIAMGTNRWFVRLLWAEQHYSRAQLLWIEQHYSCAQLLRIEQHYSRAHFLPVDLQLLDTGRSLHHRQWVVTVVQYWRHHLRRRREAEATHQHITCTTHAETSVFGTQTLITAMLVQNP